jgi:olefin beta-lactone synthetase
VFVRRQAYFVTAFANIAHHLPLMAAHQPDHPAVKIPRGRTGDGRIDYLTLTFRELNTEVDAWVTRLQGKGVRTGDRVLVMVKQGLPLIAAAFALFKLGAVPVIIDPGMGRKNFLACVARSKPRVLLGIPLAQILSHVFRAAFQTVEIRVWASGSPTARLSSGGPVSAPAAPLPIVNSAASDLAAILFTSGSTGAPKGVCYEHGMFEAQVRLVRDTYDIQPGEVDLPMLPIFALFNPALGMTTVVPELDPSRPAAVDPAKIVQAIQEQRITNSFGSPTLWRKIFDHCLEKQITLPSLKRVLCAGAAVPASLWADAARVLPNGQLHSPYGATEALPLCSISAAEISADSVAGACVGHPIEGLQVKVVPLTDGPLGRVDPLPPREIGEIVAEGPVVTRSYDSLPEATAMAKISFPRTLLSGQKNPFSNAGECWHRLGDCGYLDRDGRLWFVGRKAERVVTAAGTLHTEPCEQVFRRHPRVARCALVGLGERGRQEPALVVQPAGPAGDEASIARELRALAAQHPHTAAIRRFFFHPSFPVDVRHNAKIHRLTLARWAASQKGHEV